MPRFHSVLLVAFTFAASLALAQNPVGIFENHQDVGTVLHPGSATFGAATGTYTLRGSGENMWSTQDAFQFAWKKVSGDVELTADISFPNTTGNPHKKAVIVFRQSLEPNSVYADIALHGNGLLALQYREAIGEVIHEIKSMLSPADANAPPPSKPLRPIRLRFVRRGDYVYMFVGSQADIEVCRVGRCMGGPSYDGESIRIPLKGDFYAGIGLCAHDKNALEEATFSSIQLRNLPQRFARPIQHPGNGFHQFNRPAGCNCSSWTHRSPKLVSRRRVFSFQPRWTAIQTPHTERRCQKREC